jgi:Tol biopolymer transport system component
VREDAEGRSLWLGQTADGGSIQLRPPSEIVFGSLVFAPDGNSIYCVGTSAAKQHSVLYRMPTLGSRTETILEDIDSPPAFSPDGSKIAFIRQAHNRLESGLYLANADGGGSEILIAKRDWRARFTGSGLSWSPDGNLIAAVAVNDSDSGSGNVVLGVRPADGSLTQLTKQTWRGIYRFSWLADGSGIVMIATDKSAFEWLQVWLLSYPAGEARRITRDISTYNQSSLSVSADNTALLAVQLQQANNVWIAPSAELEQTRQVTFGSPGRLDGAYGLDWLPNGQLIYTAVNGDGMSIWRADSDGGEGSQITPSGLVERRMSTTSDGRFMIFESDRSGLLEVWRSDTNGDHPLQLTSGGHNRSAHVAPDGTFVLYASTNSGVSTIRRVSIDGGESVAVTQHESDWPRISRDRKTFACIFRASSGRPWQLAVFDINGGDPLKVFDLPETANNQNGLRWTPDGTGITYRDWKEGIWLQRLDGGDPERIPGLPKEKLYSYAWSPDADLFAFTRGTESYDVVLITGLK